MNTPIRVLFVCAGNICRSPMAEAVFRSMVVAADLNERFEIASVGTGGWHAGEKPHPGTQAVLQRYGIPLGDKRAIHLGRSDLATYDYIVAMDEENLRDIHALHAPIRGELRRLLEYAPLGNPLDVPDPYYNGAFEQVYQLVRTGCSALLAAIRAQRGV